ncbi:MAG: LexA family protein [Candidatus Paceibacteria bacterium]
MKKQTVVTVIPITKSLASKDSFPLYITQPAAGFPSPGDDMVEEALNVQELLVKNEMSTFFVRVEGNSMEGAGIFSGDILVIDRSVEPVSGKIVVAVVDGGLVVKRLKKTSAGMVLASENSDYEPIVINEQEGCVIWGVVTGSIRQF